MILFNIMVIILDEFTKKFIGLISIYILIFVVSSIAERLIPKKQKIKMETRQVSNSKYSGPVTLYPKYFLDSYFNKKEENKISNSDVGNGGNEITNQKNIFDCIFEDKIRSPPKKKK